MPPRNKLLTPKRKATTEPWSDRKKFITASGSALVLAITSTLLLPQIRDRIFNFSGTLQATEIASTSGATVNTRDCVVNLIPDEKSQNIQEGLKQSDHHFECPDGYVMIGRFHQGDENKPSGYKFTKLITDPAGHHKIEVKDHLWSESIKESSGKIFDGGNNRVITGYEHKGDENGTSRYRTSAIYVDGHKATLTEHSDGPQVVESKGGWYNSPTKHVMVGRSHAGDENGLTFHRTAKLSVSLPAQE